MTMNIRILLADDHEIFRDGLRILLERHVGLVIVADASDGLQAVAAACKEKPHVAVMDVSMPGMNGIEATRRITETLPDVKVLCLSGRTDSESVLAMLGAGASGYLVKHCTFDELLRALGAVMEGQVYLSPCIAGLVLQACKVNRAEDDIPANSPLTTREDEVLQGIAEGRSTKEIASRLHVSVKTIGTHRQHIMDKLDIHAVTGLTKYAIRQGLTTADE